MELQKLERQLEKDEQELMKQQQKQNESISEDELFGQLSKEKRDDLRKNKFKRWKCFNDGRSYVGTKI